VTIVTEMSIGQPWHKPLVGASLQIAVDENWLTRDRGECVMKKLASLALAAGLVSIMSAAAFAQPGYPMVCHGGGGMNAEIFADAIIIQFEPTDVGVGVAPPAPGQCGWLDRGYRPGEPAFLRYSGNPDGVHYLIDGVVGGGNFYVHVHKAGGAMVVDRIGP
jgi:hypothetical protein